MVAESENLIAEQFDHYVEHYSAAVDDAVGSFGPRHDVFARINVGYSTIC